MTWTQKKLLIWGTTYPSSRRSITALLTYSWVHGVRPIAIG